jgi:hypothetical protein
LDTASFLNHILPVEGIKFIALARDGEKGHRHHAAQTADEAAALAAKFDVAGVSVYHANASFKEEYIETGELNEWGKPKRKRRVQENAAFVKSLWLDLDCGDGKDYPDQRTALADVMTFCREAGIPQPLYVSSGYGVHCYWVFNKDIPAAQWRRLAAVWRSVVDHYKVKHDAVCTTDLVRILRPTGTHNRKFGKAVEVRVMGDVPPTLDVVQFANHLMSLVKEHAIAVSPARETKPKADLSSDLSAGIEYPPSSAYEIVVRCQQVRDFRDSGGDVAEPLWYAMLGLLKHTIEGDDICHEWSSGAPDYDRQTTQSKLEQWTFGPPTCERIKQLNPTGCAGCAFADKCKSPIQLGTVVPEQVAIEEVNEAAGEAGEQVPPIPLHMQERFHWDGKELSYYIKDEAGLKKKVAFCDVYLYPTQSFRDNGYVEMTWHVRERPGVFRTFEMSGEATSVGGRELFAALGRQGVVAKPGGKKAMEQYITEWFTQLRREAEEVNAYKTFGWNKDGFLLGDTLYTPDGPRKVRVQGDAETRLDAFEENGSTQEWAELVNHIYNRPGHEPFQWLIGTGFGAPLVRLMNNGVAGCIINAFSAQTAQGKSTAAKVALGIYGRADKLMLTKQQTTTLGIFGYASMLNSLPVVLDEISNTKGEELSNLVYTFSQGQGRVGMQSGGGLRPNTYNWATLLTGTANRSMHTTLAASSANATPEIARVFEYKFNRPENGLEINEANSVVPRLLEQCGAVGREYVDYLVRNQDAVREMLFKTQDVLTRKANLTQDERFWSTSATVIVTGLMIAKRLGYVAFDLKELVGWASRQLNYMREMVEEATANPIDQFGEMLNELSTGFLVTDKEGDARDKNGKAIILHAPRGDLVGRVVVASHTLYLPISVIRAWCSENRADYRQMTDELLLRGWANVMARPFPLGKGTNDYATAPSRCYKINLALAGGELEAAENVQHLKAVGSD